MLLAAISTSTLMPYCLAIKAGNSPFSTVCRTGDGIGVGKGDFNVAGVDVAEDELSGERVIGENIVGLSTTARLKGEKLR